MNKDLKTDQDKALELMNTNRDETNSKLNAIQKHLNTMAGSLTKTLTMVDNMRLINISIINRLEYLEEKTGNIPPQANGKVANSE